MKKKTVGLIIITNAEKAVLQMRGNFNIEKNKKETYRSASQLTVHGSMNEGENEIDALLRETKEELGNEFAEIVETKLNKNENFIRLNKIENENISVTNFGLRISEKDLERIKIDKQTGARIRLISKDEIKNIRELKPSERLSCVENKNDIAMFPDDIQAVKLAFKRLEVPV